MQRAKHPATLTDEMVSRATLALTNELRRKAGFGAMASLDELEPEERKGFSSDVRVALEAALELKAHPASQTGSEALNSGSNPAATRPST